MSVLLSLKLVVLETKLYLINSNGKKKMLEVMMR